jgi:Adenine specific DNA methylase Mod
MGRQYIGIEMGEHAVTHCAPRLRKVIADDRNGVRRSMAPQPQISWVTLSFAATSAA